MCCHARSASASRRRRRSARLPHPPLAMLDLSKPAERQVHDFLCRATNKHDRMWTLITLHRLGDMLLCVVRWAHPDDRSKPFSLAEVSLTETAVQWQYYATPVAARAELERRCAASVAVTPVAVAAKGRI